MAYVSPMSKVLGSVAGMLRLLAAAVEALAAGQFEEAANLIPGPASEQQQPSPQQSSPGAASSSCGSPGQAASFADATAGEPAPGPAVTEPLVCFTDLNMLNRTGCFHVHVGCSGLKKAKSKLQHANVACAMSFGLRQCSFCKRVD